MKQDINMKFKEYTPGCGEKSGSYLVSYKIDGVRAIVTGDVGMSRAGKPLPKVPAHLLADGNYECYTGSFKDTVSKIKTKGGATIHPDNFYRLDAVALDERLIINHYEYVTDTKAKELLQMALGKGYEGLVIYNPDTEIHYKVKPKHSADVVVTGWQEGTGRNKGRMGALITDNGKVGTGFTDADRELFTKEYSIGKMIEVEYMQMTEAGKFRHPRFLRERWDK